MEELTKTLDSNEDVDILYIDFLYKKASDKVSHKRLLTKTLGHAIQWKVFSRINDFERKIT